MMTAEMLFSVAFQKPMGDRGNVHTAFHLKVFYKLMLYHLNLWLATVFSHFCCNCHSFLTIIHEMDNLGKKIQLLCLHLRPGTVQKSNAPGAVWPAR